ncbi:MAG TPA: phosphate acyltransferase PlsX [Dehalococcoidia bacterium]|nr:phosphate acyltransferase PlsX [Dehalococcoidia bacterium]
MNRAPLGQEFPRIAVDAMGGDHGPAEVVRGSLLAARRLDVEIFLVGREHEVSAEIEDPPANLHVIHAPDVISMHDTIDAVKAKPESSINVGMQLVKEGKADAFVTTGNTGATLTAGLLRLGRISGIARPALGIVVSAGQGPTMILDVGANADSRPAHLIQYAHMGSAVMEFLHGIESPRIGLVSIGEEDSKGSQLVIEVNQALHASDLNFVGNIEAGQIPQYAADVAVMDGFTGNIFIKTVEGVAELVFNELRQAVKQTPWNLLAGMVLRPELLKAQRRLDYAEYGGAQLLGVDGVVFIAHGRSDARAILGGIRAAGEAVRKGVLAQMHEIANRVPARGLIENSTVQNDSNDEDLS